jgi:hypothetical protein
MPQRREPIPDQVSSNADFSHSGANVPAISLFSPVLTYILIDSDRLGFATYAARAVWMK